MSGRNLPQAAAPHANRVLHMLKPGNEGYKVEL